MRSFRILLTWLVSLTMNCQLGVSLEVEVSVEAAWPTAPLAAELLEGLVEVGQGHSFLLALAERAAQISETNVSWRDTVAEVAEGQLCCGGTSLFARFLSLQVRHATASARVEASRGLERSDRLNFLAKGDAQRCKVGVPWLLLSGPAHPISLTCDLQALRDLEARVRDGKYPWQTGSSRTEASATNLNRSPLDHVLYTSDEGSHAAFKAFGYADLGNPAAAAALLQVLFSLAKVLEAQQRAGYIAFRHGAPFANGSAPAILAGYGVNLLARSADEVVKSADGDGDPSGATVVQNLTDAMGTACTWQAAEADSSPQDPAEHFHGLDLNTIAGRHPTAKTALCEFRRDLQAAAEAPLPPWELKYLDFHAATRVTRIAMEHGGLAGLDALEEAAQDFPSGWAQALASESSGDEVGARDMLNVVTKLAEDGDLPSAGRLEINGWKVPDTKQGLLQLVHAHAPLLQAVETLGKMGFNEAQVTEVLRDSRPGLEPTERLQAGDPRLEQGSDAIVIFDIRTDPSAENMRRQGENDDMRMGMHGEDGSLIRLVQMYGRYWGYPPQIPRALLGISLTLDPCNVEHMKFVTSQFNAEKLPAVIWLRLEAAPKPGENRPSQEVQKYVSLIRGALAMLIQSPGGAPSARLFLKNWVSSQKKGSTYLCDGGAKDALKYSWERSWKRGTHPKLEPADDGQKVDYAKLPVPSATVNGRVLTGQDMFSDIEQLCKEEVQTVVRGIATGRVETGDTDEQLAAWQHGTQKGKGLLRVFHPTIKPGRGKYVPLTPAQLGGLPGGFVHQEVSAVPPTAPTIVHVLLLARPSESSSLQLALDTAAHFIDAYADRALSLSRHRRWWLGIAIEGDCTSASGATHAEGTSLSIAGAMRRCLSVAVPARAGADAVKQTRAAEFGNKLREVAAAWRKASQDVGTAKNALQNTEATKLVLKACSAMLPNGRFRESNLKVDELDVASCKAQREVENSLGPVSSGAAMILSNGRQYGPIFPDENGMKFSAAHIAFTEELELEYGHQLRGPTAKRLPWKEAPGGESASWPGAGAVTALRRAGAGDDPLLIGFAMAVRARAIEDARVVREGGKDEEGVSSGYHIEEGDDEQGISPLQKAYEGLPDNLKLHVPCAAGLPCPLRIFVVLDPLSQKAQRLPAVVRLLYKELNAEVHVLLHPRSLVEPPIVGYYRAAEAAPAPPGGLAALGRWNGSVQSARFVLPPRRNLLLSTLLHTPDAWLCSAIDSGGADLDSLPAGTGGVVRARYALEAMFVEGWATKVVGTSGGPPAAGKHLALVPLGGSTKHEGMAGSDSVVVKSGYFQLRVPPGLYNLVLQGATEETLLLPKGPVELAALAGRGSVLEVHVGKNEDEKALANTASSAATDYEGFGGDKSSCTETIHIFSVASGHRYERLLRIMVRSVREHTQCPLRLWLVENFLSPNFRRLLPALAEKVGFAVSRVTYKWPAWLREQTQKQRVIWAYKILFLDVLFPLQVKRVLFIDADQIVRADVKELWDTDLSGRVYGFVPFCGSGPPDSSWFGSRDKGELRNPETVGLRFWEQGFWQQHLGSDKYYHISALFVVDLDLFRSIGAGDILREVYQSLTADPHSLANLDQDLPNYVQQRQLQIFSLPQDWLWCETWCSESTKAQAKTIDMCQNPNRKEGKLQQARRIAPEWTKYDMELAAIIQKATNSSSI